MRSASPAPPAGLPGAIAPVDGWVRYRDNLARHLSGISRDLELRLMHALIEHGHDDLRHSFGPILYLLWDEARPLSVIADELGMTRQAASQAAGLAEQVGYVERLPNPADGRSKLVVLTGRGRDLVEHAVQALVDSERDYAGLVGGRAVRRFVARVVELRDGMRLPAHPNPALATRARSSIGTLPLVALRINTDLFHAASAAGHTELRTSHHELLPLIGPAGARVNEIARVQRVSRQAISAAVQEIEALGYLERRPDPTDGRGVVFVPTTSAHGLVGSVLDALDGLEARSARILGGAGYEQLREIAGDLYHAVRLEAALADPRQGPASRPGPGAEPDVAGGGASGIEELATHLRRRLGNRDAARLAALLAPGER